MRANLRTGSHIVPWSASRALTQVNVKRTPPHNNTIVAGDALNTQSSYDPSSERAHVYKHILIATDGSELAAKAVTQGLGLAKALGAKATAVTVSEPWNFILAALAEREHRAQPLAEYEQCTDAAAERIFWIVHQLARRFDQACATLHIKDRYPADGILEAAEARGCDLIVMGSKGRRGFAKVLLGSQTSRVLALSSTSVLVCR